jgi:hypothetical protein
MAIGTIQGALGGIYDINRDMYYDDARRYDREMQYRRMQEEEYRRMQNSHYSDSATLQQGKLVNPTPKPDPKDPLSFLSKADNKLLLTGEAP